jgi:hypothetical protein
MLLRIPTTTKKCFFLGLFLLVVENISAATQPALATNFFTLPPQVVSTEEYLNLHECYFPSEFENALECLQHNTQLLVNNKSLLLHPPKIPSLGSKEKIRICQKILSGYDAITEDPIECAASPTSTTIGNLTLQHLLANQKTLTPEALQKQQAIVEALLTNPVLARHIGALLETCKKHESGFLWFWKELDEATTRFLNIPYFYSDGQTGASGVNKNAGLLHLKNLVETLILPCTISFIFAYYVMNSCGPAAYVEKIFRDIIASTIVTSISLSCLMKAICITAIPGKMHHQLQPVHNFALAITQLSKIAAKNTVLEKNLCVKEKSFFFHQQHSEEFKALLQNLGSSTLRSKSSLFSNHGKLLATFKMMYHCKDQFIDSLKLIGELDAYLALAKMEEEKK